MIPIVLAIGWVVGLATASLVPPLSGLPLAAFLGGSLGLAAIARRRLARFAGIALLGLILATVRAQMVTESEVPLPLAGWIGTAELTVVGSIRGEVLPTSTGDQVGIAVQMVRTDSGAGPATGLVLARYRALPYRHGDRVEASGFLRELRPTVPSEQALAREGFHAILAVQTIEASAEDPTLSPIDRGYRLLGDLKVWSRAALRDRIAAPEATLAEGLLLGGSSGLPFTLTESLRRAGLSHLVAVSGYNVALVVAFLLPISLLLSSRSALVIPLMGVWLFTLLVGSPPSAVRAAAMASLAILARWVGRPTDATAGLAVATVAITAIDPTMFDDLGLQLSALATAGLVGFSDHYTRALARVWPSLPGAPGANRWLVGIRDVVAATLAVETLTLPLIAAHFGQIAVLSPVANVLALPAVPLAMAASSVVLLLEPLGVDEIARVAGWIAWLPSAWILLVARAIGDSSLAAWSFPRPAPPLLALFYGGIGILLAFIHARSVGMPGGDATAGILGRARTHLSSRIVVVGAVAALVAWLGFLVAPSRHGEIRVYARSDAVVLQALGRVVVLSPGRGGAALAADLGQAIPFWRVGLDVAFATDAAERLTVRELPDRLRPRVLFITNSLAAASGSPAWERAILEDQVLTIGDLRVTLVTRDDRGFAVVRRGATQVILADPGLEAADLAPYASAPRVSALITRGGGSPGADPLTPDVVIVRGTGSSAYGGTALHTRTLGDVSLRLTEGGLAIARPRTGT